MSVKTKQCSRCLTFHLDRTYNDHAQKCRCLCKHSPTSIEAGDTRIILAVTRLDICGWMIIKATAFLAWPLYILFKCDVRHHLHCLVLRDTNLYKFTKGKTYLVNQRWRHSTCLQHPCYDVGCYPCLNPIRWIKDVCSVEISLILVLLFFPFNLMCNMTTFRNKTPCRSHPRGQRCV